MSSTKSRAARAFALALTVLGTGCVVTTFEGQGDPPRVAVAPPPPGHKKGSSGGDPSSGETFAEAPARAEDRIGARHILVMYSGSKRAPATVTRSREEALQRAEQARTRALAGEDFAALVREYSDEPGAGERGGDLGRFERRMMVKPFADAAFALEIGAISTVVETDFGYHVIQRTE